MKLSQEEIKKRIHEVGTKLDGAIMDVENPEKAAALEGEIFGLQWVLTFWNSGYYEKPSEVQTIMPPY